MNEFIKLEVPFNENTGRENQQFFFRYKWKKGFTELKKAVIYALIFLLLGFFSQSKLINNSPASVIFRYTGFIFLAYIFLLLYQFFTSKKKFYKSLEEQIGDFKQKTDKASSFIILNKDNITIENSFNTIGSVWSKTNYTFADKYLILGILNSNFNFVFTKTDFKEDDYKTFTNFLEQYSREQK